MRYGAANGARGALAVTPRGLLCCGSQLPAEAAAAAVLPAEQGGSSSRQQAQPAAQRWPTLKKTQVLNVF
jgi:hypothetical protein